MTVVLPIRVTMLSDWAVGDGTARHGSVDRRVRRDEDGLPILPGKTLRGLLREATGQAAFALDNGQPGEWMALHEELFGGPARAGRLIVSSARMTPWIRQEVATHPQLAAGFIGLRASTAIDDKGVALTDSLRLEERARAGCVLLGSIDVDVRESWWKDEERSWGVRLLLSSGSLLMSRLGGKRRRGNGRCSVSIEGLDVTTLYSGASGPPPALERVSQVEGQVSDSDKLPDWVTHEITVTTRSPVLVPDRVVGNVTVGLDHIPGALLLGLLARTCPGVDEAIANDAFVVTTGTPVSGSERSLPAPLSFQEAKVQIGAVEDKVVDITRGDLRLADGVLAQTVATGGFVQVDSKGVTRLTRLPGMVHQTHVTIDSETQRAKDAALFTYAALPAGMTYRALVHTRARVDVMAAKGSHRIGSARSTEYGDVQIDVIPREGAETAPDLNKSDQLAVWLVSDLTLPGGVVSAEDVRKELASALGVDLAWRSDSVFPDVVSSVTRRDSWQARWGLPRPTIAAVSAGSVFRFTLGDRVPGARLMEIQRTGLGVRRAEGFGQVVFNPEGLVGHPVFTPRAVPYRPPEQVSATNGSGPEDQEQRLIDAVRATVLKDAVGDIATSIAADHNRLNGIIPRRPSASQLGSLRRVLESVVAPNGLPSEADLARGKQWAVGVEKTKSRKEKWPGWDMGKLQQWFEDPSSFVQVHAPEANEAIRELVGADLQKRYATLVLQQVILACLAASRDDFNGIEEVR
jgi:CRISPR-associated protein Csx10